MGSFSSINNILYNGYTGLQASQQALNVVAQNVANANTEGYSRQRVDLAAIQTTPSPGLYTGGATQFNGVEVTGVERIKNEFLQASADLAVSKQSTLQAQQTPLNDVQNLLNEPSTNGLATALDTFYQAWTALGNTPDSQAAGNNVIGDGNNVAGQLNQLANGVEQEWSNQHNNLASIVDQVNAAAKTVATLNVQIKQGAIAGADINSLSDERDKAVNTLSSLVGAQAITGSDGQISISISGVGLVNGPVVTNPLTVNGPADISSATTQPTTLSVGGVTATPSSGSAAGLLASLNTDLPNVNSQLDTIANSLITAVNTVHDAGYLYQSSTQGDDFFTGTGARGIAVAITDPADLAVSATAGAQDGSNAQNLGELANDTTASTVLGGAQSPSQDYRSMVAGLATQISDLNTAITSQTAIVTTTQNAVDSDSGVDMDEELTNMILFQRSYQASAKVISTADQMYQTLIGMVQ
jgi:flagellar hook-associated protein 1 FlgK